MFLRNQELNYFFRIVIILTFFFTVFRPGYSQQRSYQKTHEDYHNAFLLLQQGMKNIPDDSVLFENEYRRVFNSYKAVEVKLKKEWSIEEYVHFAADRLIHLSYVTQDIDSLKTYHTRLFKLAAEYPDQLENDSIRADEIAKCVVNSYEMSGIYDKDTLLQAVSNAVHNHYALMQAGDWPLKHQQAFVNRYAAQYYRRGIVSMAEPVFRSFRAVFDINNKIAAEWTSLNNAATGTDDTNHISGYLSAIDAEKIVIITKQESAFKLIYLISQLRAAHESFRGTPVIIIRNKRLVSDSYLSALKRNLAGIGFYQIDLVNDEWEDVELLPEFTFFSADTEVMYSTNSAIDFLEWLEEPVSAIKEYEKQRQKKLFRERLSERKSPENLARDTTVKLDTLINNTRIVLRGEWTGKLRVSVEKFYHLQRGYELNPAFPRVALLEVYNDQNLIFSDPFIQTDSGNTIGLISDHRFQVQTIAYDMLNQRFIALRGGIDSLFLLQSKYQAIVTEYPFSESDFFKGIALKCEHYHYKIIKMIQAEQRILHDIALADYNIKRLKSFDPPDVVRADEMISYSFVNTDKELIYRSPYFIEWINAWLSYGVRDLTNAMELLLGSEIIPPGIGSEDLVEYFLDVSFN